MNAFYSPFIIPVAGILLGLVLGLGNIISQMKARELRAQHRLALLNRGMSPADIEAALGSVESENKAVRDPLRSLGTARRTALVLLSSGIGFSLFGLLLAAVVRQRETLVVPALGLVPIAIGVGFLIDYNLQKRELARFGMEVDAEAGWRFPVRDRI